MTPKDFIQLMNLTAEPTDELEERNQYIADLASSKPNTAQEFLDSLRYSNQIELLRRLNQYR